MLGFIRTNSRCLHPIHITCLSFLRSVSTTTSSGSATFPVCFLPPSRPRLPIDELESSYIVSSFSDWFRRGSDPVPLLLDQIYSAFAFSADASSLNSALSRLRLRLSEDFVLRFLRHRPHPSVIPNSADVSNSLLQLRIRFFDWCTHQPCYFHTRTVYHALFRLLYRHNHVSFVMDCLQRFSESGRFSLFPGVATVDAMKGHSRFYYTLVIGYSVIGCAERALQLFSRMRYYGVDLDYFGYHVLLNSLVEASYFEFADSVFDQINARGFSGPVTDCIRMKSLCCQGRLDDAALFLRQLYLCNHREVADRSVATLVQALCKAGRVECARHFVEEFSNSEAYGALISFLLSARKVDVAMEILRKRKTKDSEQHILHIFHYNQLIQLLLRQNMLEEVCDVLVEMMEEGISPDQYTMDAALCFFCKAGMVDVVLELYDLKMKLGMTPNRRVYNLLIQSLCQEGKVNEVLRVLKECMNCGYFPGNQTFTLLSFALLQMGKLKQLRSLLEEAKRRKFRSIIPIHARYVSALCKNGAVNEAYLELLNAGVGAGVMMYRSSYCNLIRAFIELGMVEFPPVLLIQMQELGFKPGRRLYREVVGSLCDMEMFDMVLVFLNKQLEIKKLDVRTCYNYVIYGAAHSKKPEMAMEVYSRMVNAGIEANIETDILILRCYVKSRRFGDAFSFFRCLITKRMPVNKLYNVFICGFCEAGKVDHAIELWKDMREKRLLPNLKCYEELLRALCSVGNYDATIEVIKDFEDTGRQVSSFICNVFLLHTLKSQKLLKTWYQSYVMGDGNSIVDNQGNNSSVVMMLGHLIYELSGVMRMKENLEKFDEVIEQHFPMDIYTYNLLLRASFKAGRMDCAYNLFCRMLNKGYEPNRWTYDTMVHGFCKLGYSKFADKWMEEMSRKGYLPTLCTLRVYNKI